MYGDLPSSTYSAAVMSSGINGSCGTYATSSARRRLERRASGAPSTRIVPALGTRPTTARSSDDLPAPFGPIRPSHSPDRIVPLNGQATRARATDVAPVAHG